MAENNKASEWSISLVAFSSCSFCCHVSSVFYSVCCIKSVLVGCFFLALLSSICSWNSWSVFLKFALLYCIGSLVPSFLCSRLFLIALRVSYLPSYLTPMTSTQSFLCSKHKTQLSSQLSPKLNKMKELAFFINLSLPDLNTHNHDAVLPRLC